MGPEMKAQGLILSSPPQGVQLIYKKLQYVSKTDGRTFSFKSKESSLVDIQISVNGNIQEHFSMDFYRGWKITQVMVVVPRLVFGWYPW